ncbi:hypothetical protein SAMN05660706_13631 [Desulfoscipio geothermicus DSM 3669]|uniref:Uncharacterized protein n=1 Tax=Desulfoscipio geothermicus DSM 3669 TaxID=1121426 RepID=A0A1I6EDD0_9FIRM|nr:hypothetical protein SAMN05660706_13631 [Desulfoscipio geothermicus DSM 3669]
MVTLGNNIKSAAYVKKDMANPIIIAWNMLMAENSGKKSVATPVINNVFSTMTDNVRFNIFAPVVLLIVMVILINFSQIYYSY